MRVLVVKTDFMGFQKGDRITDPEKIRAARKSHSHAFVEADHDDVKLEPVKETAKAPAPAASDKK